MTAVRPCTHCGRDEPLGAAHCTACGRELVAVASPPPDRAALQSARAVSLRSWLLPAVAVAVTLAAGAWLLLRGGEELGPPAPAWHRSDSVSRWARERLAERGLPASSVEATTTGTGAQERRTLVLVHRPEQDPPDLLRAAADLLVEARGEGERLLTHVAVVEFGPEAARRAVSLSVGDAARARVDEDALAGWIEEAVSVRGRPLAAFEPPAAPGQVEEPDARQPLEPEDPEPPANADAGPPEPDAAAGPPPGAGGAGGEPAASPRRSTGPARPPAALGRGDEASPPAPIGLLPAPQRTRRRTLPAGGEDVPLLGLVVHPRSERALVLRSVGITVHGTLDDPSGIEYALLVHDADGDGQRSAGDRLLGRPATAAEDDGRLVFEDLAHAFGADGRPLRLVCIIKTEAGAASGTLMVRIIDATDLQVEEVESSRLCPVTGTPLNGPMVAVRARR